MDYIQFRACLERIAMDYFKESSSFNTDEERYEGFFAMLNLEKYKEKLVQLEGPFQTKEKPDFRMGDSTSTKYKLKPHSKLNDQERRSRISSTTLKRPSNSILNRSDQKKRKGQGTTSQLGELSKAQRLESAPGIAFSNPQGVSRPKLLFVD